MNYRCDDCGREFPKEYSLKTHKQHCDDEPYKDRETLYEMYHENGMTQAEIAEEFGCCDLTISNWMDKLDVDTKDCDWKVSKQGPQNPAFVNHACYSTDERGYSYWQSKADDNKTVSVHRLAAVAWFGIDEVKDKVVHHENGVKWDTREDNLSVMTDPEHKSHHANKRERDGSVFV